MKPTKKVLFVCLGNICRSPMAEGLFRHLVDHGKASKLTNDNHSPYDYEIDSAGTGAWHIGNAPDARAISTLKSKGIDISTLKARQINVDDFYHFDYVVAMDSENYQNCLALKHQAEASAAQVAAKYPQTVAKLVKLLAFGEHKLEDVPDPYFGSEDGFEHCYQLIVNASQNLKKFIESQ